MGYELMLPIDAIRAAQTQPMPVPARLSLMETVLSWFSEADDAARDAHLSQATSHEDLEARARQWDEAEQRALTMFAHRVW